MTNYKKLDHDHDFEIWHVPSNTKHYRYVVHYLTIPFAEDPEKDFFSNQAAHIRHAKSALYGRSYGAKWFGGGIVFEAYAGNPIDHVLAAIEGINPAEYYQRKLDASK